MPYSSPADLPERVKKHLPVHAQHIFVEAFNNAYNEYQSPKSRRDPHEDHEAVAFKVAWSAVKNEYHKEGNRWVPNADGEEKKRHSH